mgnify:CR=1 FL=1
MQIQEAIKQLCKITNKLKNNHKSKRFTLDGRLVGDLGEVLAEENYEITLFDNIQPLYDAKTHDGKMVQIKATFKDKLTFPTGHIPELFLGLKLNENGSFDEIYNGPGKYIKELISNRKSPYNRLHLLPIKKLLEISSKITEREKIKKK